MLCEVRSAAEKLVQHGLARKTLSKMRSEAEYLGQLMLPRSADEGGIVAGSKDGRRHSTFIIKQPNRTDISAKY